MVKKFNLSQPEITKIAGFCGILIPIVIFTFIGLAISQSPWFRWTDHALSDLGVEGISAFLFNNGIILSGILAFVFSLGLIKELSNKAGAYLFSLSSLALIGIGIWPENIDTLHSITSAAFFVLIALFLIVTGFTIKQDQFERSMGSLAIIFAVLAIGSTAFLIFWKGIAIPESFSCFPAFVWCMIFGIKMTNVKRLTGALSSLHLGKALQD